MDIGFLSYFLNIQIQSDAFHTPPESISTPPTAIAAVTDAFATLPTAIAAVTDVFAAPPTAITAVTDAIAAPPAAITEVSERRNRKMVLSKGSLPVELDYQAWFCVGKVFFDSILIEIYANHFMKYFNVFSLSLYGAYLTGRSSQVCLVATPFLCEKISKVRLP